MRALALALLLAAPSARATILNPEPLRDKLTPGSVKTQVAVSVKGKGGREEELRAGAGVFLGGQGGSHLAFMSANGDYKTEDGVVDTLKGTAHFRYNYLWLDWLTPEAFTQVEHDRDRALDLRALFGVGPRFTIIPGIYVGSAYMLEHNDAIETFLWHRWSNYLALVWEPDERVNLSSSAFYQPVFTDFENYRIWSVSVMGFKVLKWLTSSVGASFRYEAVSPEGIKPFEWEISNSLGVTF